MSLLEVALISLLPFFELRLAIPYGIFTGLDPLSVFVVAVIMNALVVFPVYLFLDHVFPVFENWKISKTLLSHTRKKTKKFIQRYGVLGLLLFVAIPLPGSGAYTGCLAAKIFGIPKKESLLPIWFGVVAAAFIVTLWSLEIFESLLLGTAATLGLILLGYGLSGYVS